ERIEDIPILVEHFLSSLSVRFDRTVPPVCWETMRSLQGREWPGNIRELENCVTRYVVIGPEEILHGDEGKYRASADGGKRTLAVPGPLKHAAKQAIRELERSVILKSLEVNHWNRRKAAEALKISYRSLIYKIREASLLQKRPRTRKTVETG